MTKKFNISTRILTLFAMIAILITSLPLTVFAKEKNNDACNDVNEEAIIDPSGIRLADEDSDDLYSMLFGNENGVKTKYIYNYPVKYITTDGRVADKSVEIVDAKDSFITASSDIVSTFSKKISDGITVSYKDTRVELIPVFADAETMGELSDNRRVSYNIDKTTSLEYSLTYMGIKEEIVVEEYNGVNTYDFLLKTGGLVPVEIDGSCFLVDSNGEIVVLLGDVLIFSADEYNNTLGKIEFTTVEEGQEYILTVIVDEEYLTDEKTAYPIVIDPSIEIRADGENPTRSIEDVTICSTTTYGTQIGSFYIGTNSSGNPLHSLMRFVGSDLTQENVLGAYVTIRDLRISGTPSTIDVECYEYIGNAWSESGTVTWNGVGSNYIGELLDAKRMTYAIGNALPNKFRYTFDITELAQKWSSGAADPGKGIIFKASSEYESSGTNAYSAFASYNRSTYQPTFVLSYADVMGLNPTFSAETYTLDDHVTNYVGHKYGNLVSVYSMPVTAGEFPLDVFYVFNGTYANSEFFDYHELGSTSYGKFQNGWKLSLTELLISEGNNYRYIDAYGTEYLWRLSSTSGEYLCEVYEDGLLTKNSDNTFTLDLGDSIKRHFNSSGLVTSIVYLDSTYSYNYSSNKLSSISCDGTTLLSFTYSGNYLRYVNYYNRAQTTSTLSYEVGTEGSTVFIKDIYGNSHTYDYSESSFIVSSGLTTYNYSFSNPSKVTQIQYHYGTNQINTTAITYTDDSTIYENGQCKIRCTFDAAGRTINTITESSDGKNLYNASYASYSDEGDLLSSDTAGEGDNLLINSNMNLLSTWAGSLVDGPALMGGKSMLLYPGSNLYTPYVYQSVNCSAGDYVFSAYIKVKDISLLSNDLSGGVYLKVTNYSSGNTIAESDKYVFTNDDGWMRIWLPVNIQTSGYYSFNICTSNLIGDRIYIDCAQLEKGTTPSTYNSLLNGTFENGTSSWTGGTVVTSNTLYGNNSLIIPTSSPAYQVVTLGGTDNRGFTVSGFAKLSAKSINAPYIRLTFSCSDGTYVKDLPFDGSILDKQYIAYNVSVPESYGTINSVNYAIFNPTSGALIVDDLILSFGEYYTIETETVSTGLNFVSSNDGTCYLNGKGSCQDEDIVIPEKSPAGDIVIMIASGAFRNDTSIKSIYIPETVHTIRYDAFYGCTSLEAVTGCEGLESIERNAFRSCTSLTDFYFSDTLISLGKCAFSYCPFTEVTLPDKLVSMVGYTFSFCGELESVTFTGNSLTSIPEGMFTECVSLKDIILTDSITAIDAKAFYNCTSIERLQISKSLTSIASNAFYGCPSSAITATSGSSLSVSTSLIPGTIHYNSEISGNFMYTYSETGEGGKSTEVTYIGDAGENAANTKMFTSVTYDGNGNIISYTDESGNTTTYEYNSYGDLTKVTNAKGVETTYTYNTSGLLTTVSSAGMTNTYAYTNGQVTSVTHTGSSFSETYNFTYDTYGNLTSVKVGTQPLVTYTYDGTVKDRLVSMSYPNSYTETYAYDIFGNVVSTSVNNTVRYKYTYDADGSLVYFTDLQNSVHDSYCYDEYGFTVKYTFDSTGCIVKNEEIDNDAATNEETDVFDRVTKKTVTTDDTDVIIRNFGYDNDSNYYSSYLTKIESFSNGGTENIIQYSYEYDPLGNLTAVKENDTIKLKYTYDDLSQLIREDNYSANKSYTWTYDGNGNILNKKTYTYTTGTLGNATSTETNTYSTGSFKDQMTSHAGHTISYDSLGNPTNWYTGTKSLSNMTWEGRRLSGLTVSSTAYNYSYNSDGIRIKKQNGSNVIEYLYDDSGNLVEEKHATYSIYFIYDDSGELIGFKVSEGGTYYYGKDVFGVIKYIYNSSGTIVGSYTYDAWGNTISYTCTSETFVNPIRYKDYYFDTESGFYYLQSRYYDPQVGRFISADDVRFLVLDVTVLSLNIYVYCENSPTVLFDNKGTYSLSISDFKSDWAGREILWHYLYGKGKKFKLESTKWAKYIGSSLMCRCCGYDSSQTLNEYIIKIVRKSMYMRTTNKILVRFCLTTKASVQNGEGIIGYNYLHGTNANVGGLELQVSVLTVSWLPGGKRRIVQVSCVWHDMIDPNFQYSSDTYKAKLAKFIPFARPTNYEIEIRWTITWYM